MAVIYLRHPKHGTKVATMDLEADYDEKSGWERYTVGTQPDVVVPAFLQASVDAAPLNQLEVKRGRPRKHME